MIIEDLKAIEEAIKDVQLIEVEGGDGDLEPVAAPALSVWLSVKDLIQDAIAVKSPKAIAAIALVVVKQLQQLASSKWVKGDLDWVLHLAELVEEEAKRIL